MLSKEQRAQIIDPALQRLYPSPLPPLVHKDAYTLLLAVLLSARCTDACVNRVTPALFALADTPLAMSQCSVVDVQAIIRSCGLSPQKAKAIVGLSQKLITEHAGQVPSNFEALEALPGIGHKSASVVMAQAFNQAAFPVDTHIYRMAHRWKLSEARSISRVEADLKALFPKNRWISLHLQFIYYAREHCPARRCYGKECLLCKELNGEEG